MTLGNGSVSSKNVGRFRLLRRTIQCSVIAGSLISQLNPLAFSEVADVTDPNHPVLLSTETSPSTGKSEDNLGPCLVTPQAADLTTIFYSYRDKIVPLLTFDEKTGDYEEFTGNKLGGVDSVIDQANGKLVKTHFVSYGNSSGGCGLGSVLRNGKLAGKRAWTIFTTTNSHLRFNFSPTAEQHKRFDAIFRNTCGAKGPTFDTDIICNNTMLVATSDMDHDGNEEYWYTMTAKYDEGFAVSEWNAKAKTFEEITSNCEFCPD